jgi:hypothetical protein
VPAEVAPPVVAPGDVAASRSSSLADALEIAIQSNREYVTAKEACISSPVRSRARPDVLAARRRDAERTSSPRSTTPRPTRAASTCRLELLPTAASCRDGLDRVLDARQRLVQLERRIR